MCGRFTFDIPSVALADSFGLAELPTIAPQYNFAPTHQIPIIRQNSGGQNRLDYLQWGLIPSWAKERSIASTLIDAWSETVTEKSSFKQAVQFRRCLVPASGFYEWKQKGRAKRPMYVHLKDSSPMIFAGLGGNCTSSEGEEV
jgi:putative SOS response-associated peptidase YedK